MHVWSVSCPEAHVGAPHVVPLAALQVPAPSHTAAWQVAALAMHCPRGLVPADAFAHMPLLAGRLHCMQAPVQAPSQHTPSTQWFEVQSPGLVHVTPSAAGWHLAFVHVPDAQSRGARQPAPAPQGLQSGPPQSTSVSPPSFTPSEQLAGAHLPDAHTFVLQSFGTLQPRPGAHALGHDPPQSMSVSSPSFTPSMHVIDAS
jgi:hypothetical protein